MRIAYDVYGEGGTTVVLVPPWAIVDSRSWKLQVPFLARHFRVVTFDGRGSGRSSRPVGASAYSDAEHAEDLIAVLDASGTRTAVLVGLSCGATWAVRVAATHPERVRGVVAIAPACRLDVGAAPRDQFRWDDHLTTTDGWAKHNKHYWLEGGYDDFRGFFFDQMFNDPHSTRQIEDALAWSADVEPGTLADTEAGRLGLEGARTDPMEPFCTRVRCPVLVMHGTEDRIRTHRIGERLAELTHGSLVLLEGAGHGLPTRHPVRVNAAIREFTEGTARKPNHRPPGPRTRAKRVLFASSPIGLGHALRDLAIADQMRLLHPGLQVDWLTQSPVAAVLDEAGERVHPASHWLANESAHIEAESGEHDLHVFDAIRRMDEIMVNNFMVFDELVAEGDHDLVVADEAWDIDHFLHECPERKRCAFAWLTDFVGWLPMPDGGDNEARLTADYNAEMIEHRSRHPGLRDRSVFVGHPDDVVADSFGPGLPSIREWTEQNFEFSGYVTGSATPGPRATRRLRHQLGLRPEELLCVVSVGGSGVGSTLLRAVLDAVPEVRRLVPELRFLVVCGPRIDPASLPHRRGAEIRGYLPGLHRYLAAADVAVVQGGLTTCMELAATRTPFLYVPLEHHFEQNFHVRHRLERYGVGRHLAWADAAQPEVLAENVVAELHVEPGGLPVESDGAAHAAALIAALL